MVKLLTHQRLEELDICLAQEVVRGADGSLPQPPLHGKGLQFGQEIRHLAGPYLSDSLFVFSGMQSLTV